jgi:hypothetical protein
LWAIIGIVQLYEHRYPPSAERKIGDKRGQRRGTSDVSAVAT